MITAADAEPGTRSRIAVMTSEWCTTATAPIRIGRDWLGSRVMTKGRRIPTAAVPPSPGSTPIANPAATPIASIIKVAGFANPASAFSAASSMVESSGRSWSYWTDVWYSFLSMSKTYFLTESGTVKAFLSALLTSGPECSG